jgi:hypothetical protein
MARDRTKKLAANQEAELHRIAHDAQNARDRAASFRDTPAERKLLAMGYIRSWGDGASKWCAPTQVGKDYIRGMRK